MAPRFDRPYADLAEADKDENRAAARRIPEVLAKVGLGLRGADDGDGAGPALSEAELREALALKIETLAKAEHDRWVAHRKACGWHYGPKRDDEAKIHPSMVSYAKLSEGERDKDRSNVRHYPEFIGQAGLKVVRLG